MTSSLLLIARGPDHAPEATQSSALVEDHDSLLVAPTVIEVGLAAKLSVGARPCVTLTVDERVIDPPAPRHSSE